MVLVRNLPPSGAYARAVGGDGWSLEEHLAASTLEVVHGLLRVTLAANSKKGAKLPKPLRIPRGKAPKIEAKPAGGLTREGVRAYLMGPGGGQ